MGQAKVLGVSAVGWTGMTQHWWQWVSLETLSDPERAGILTSKDSRRNNPFLHLNRLTIRCLFPRYINSQTT
jgi:hypothetical protein